MESTSLLLLLVAVTSFYYASGLSDNSAFAAGRSQEELEYVRSKIQEIEKVVVKKLNDDGRDVPYTIDKQSRFYKNMMMGAIDDILLSVNDVDHWLDAVRGKRNKRGALYTFDLYPEKKWSMPIKYMIDKTTIVNSTSRGIIRDAIAAWERQTCVKFQEVFSDPGEKYLYFVNIKGGGCKSYVGKVDYSNIEEKYAIQYERNRQPVFLEDPGCYLSGGIPMHEIGHALGLYHEAQRLDRDRYIQVYYDNIRFGDQSNFIQPTYMYIETKGVPYDIGSVMQYGALEFSYDTEKFKFVILPREREKVFVLGQTSYIGFYDAKIVSMAYCPAFNPDLILNCQNYGYHDPKSTSNCKCPAQWTGKKCETLAPSSPGCTKDGGVISHSELDLTKTFSLMSPNYMNLERNGTFTQGDHCYWKIEAPHNHQIVWWIDNTTTLNIPTTFGLTMASTAGCLDWVEIRKPSEFRGRRLCGLLNATIHSEISTPKYSQKQILYIDFRSFENNLFAKKISQLRRGFHLKYEIKHISARDPWAKSTQRDYSYTYHSTYPWNKPWTRKPLWDDWRKPTIKFKPWSTSSTEKPDWSWETNHIDPYNSDMSSTNGIIIPLSVVGGIVFFVIAGLVICAVYSHKRSTSIRLIAAEEIQYPDVPTNIPTATSNVPQDNRRPIPLPYTCGPYYNVHVVAEYA